MLLVGLPSSQKDYGQIMDFMVRCVARKHVIRLLLMCSVLEEGTSLIGARVVMQVMNTWRDMGT